MVVNYKEREEKKRKQIRNRKSKNQNKEMSYTCDNHKKVRDSVEEYIIINHLPTKLPCR